MTDTFKYGHALVIGIGADLPSTVDDANDLATILRDEGRCAYPPSQVHLLTGPSAIRETILNALDKLAQSTGWDATVVVYFSGHGYQVTSSMGDSYFLLPYGYDINRLKQTAVSGAEFATKLRTIPAQKLLVLLDCCHAGGVGDAKAPGLEFAKSPLPPETLALLAEGKGRVLIASSKENELSYAGKPYSAFTLALMESLSGIGVAKQDGFVRVADIALHAREVVPGRTGGKQHPILHFEHADNFALAYYAGGDKKPKGLPFDVEPEIEPEPGAWRVDGDMVMGDKTTIFDQRGQTVGTQTNIAGNVTGPVLSGQFDGPVAVGGGEAVDMRGSQGAVYKPSGLVKQHFGERITITGDGNVIGNNNRVNVNKSQATGVTVDEFLHLIGELRQAVPQVGLDSDETAAAVADLDVVERQAQKPQPKPAFILAKLNGILSLLATADGVWGLTERVTPLAQQALEWAQQLF